MATIYSVHKTTKLTGSDITRNKIITEFTSSFSQAETDSCNRDYRYIANLDSLNTEFAALSKVTHTVLFIAKTTVASSQTLMD